MHRRGLSYPMQTPMVYSTVTDNAEQGCRRIPQRINNGESFDKRVVIATENVRFKHDRCS